MVKHISVVSVELIDLEDDIDVYDIEVDIDHSFIVAGVIAHNCPTCGALDGKRWTTDSKPINHSMPYRAPPNHWRCRCSMIPVLKTWRELGINMDELSDSTRVSMEGQVTDKTFSDWLKRKTETDPTFADRTLGKGRAELWRNGKITMDQMIAGGKPLSLSELKKKYGAPDSFWAKGTQQAPWHDASFANSPDWMKQVIKKNDGDFEGLIPYIKGKDAFMRRKKIHVASEDISTYNSQGTWRHEYGHFLDYNLSADFRKPISSSDKFINAIKLDTDEIVSNSGYGSNRAIKKTILNEKAIEIKAIKDDLLLLKNDDSSRKLYLLEKSKKIGLTLDDIESFISKETIHTKDTFIRDYRSAFLIKSIENRDAAMFMDALSGSEIENIANFDKGLIGCFSDIVGSATKNKLLGLKGPHGNGGHPTKYYNEDERKGPAEIFANLVSLKGSGDAVWDKTIDSFYPRLSVVFKDVLNE